jgi:hypothetical protein
MSSFEVKKLQALADFGQLTGNAQEALCQLFVSGPTWDGNLVTKNGRNELINRGLAIRVEGWQQLTEAGLVMAISVNVRAFTNPRWHRKQQCL